MAKISPTSTLTVWNQCPSTARPRRTLTDIEANQIADISRQLESSRGSPQDLEWAIQGDELFILQTRPLTTTPPLTSSAIKGRWILFKPTAENFSEPFTPMTVDLLRRVVPPFGLMVQGRFYISADLMERLLPWKLEDESLADLLLMRGQPPEARLDWRRVMLMIGTLSARLPGRRRALASHRASHHRRSCRLRIPLRSRARR